VQGTPERIQYIREMHDLAILGEFTPVMFRYKRGIFTVVLFMLAVLPVPGVGSAVGLLPDCCRFYRADQGPDSRKSLHFHRLAAADSDRGHECFGEAMEKRELQISGRKHRNAASAFGTMAILTGFILLTVILTQPMSNAAAAL
jgi:hypothetical protein